MYYKLYKTLFVCREMLAVVKIIFLGTKYAIYIQFVIYLCSIYSYKRKRLQYEVVSNSAMKQNLKTVQIQAEEQQLNISSIQKQMPRNALMTW